MLTRFSLLVTRIWKKAVAFLRPTKYKIPNTKYLQKGFIKITKHLLINYLIVATVFFGGGLFFLFNPFGTKSTDAAWFNDNWAYRKAITVTVTSSASDIANLQTLLTLDRLPK